MTKLNLFPRINGYSIQKQFSSEPSGLHFKATDQSRKGRCHLTLLTSAQAELNNVVQRAQQAIEQEAEQLYNLDHPRIAPYRKPFTTRYQNQTCPVLVQAWINGTSYKQHLKTRRFDPTQVLRFLQDTLPILVYLHHRKIIHGDIRPSNLIYCQDSHKPTLINFAGPQRAIWQNITPSNLQTAQIPTLYANPVFSPPEQQNGKIHSKSDLYALAVTAVALLTGQNDPSIFYDKTRQRWNWQHNASISAEMNRVLELMLQPDPDDRPSVQELNQLIQQGIPTSTPNPAPAISSTFPDTEAPPSQAKTVAAGRKALDTIALWGTRTPHYTDAAGEKYIKASEPALQQLLAGMAYFVFLLFVIGFFRQGWYSLTALFNPRQPVSPFLLAEAVDTTSNSETSASPEDFKDCRDDVLSRGETLQIESWQPVDQRFSESHPNIDAIDPLDPKHRVHIQTWCGIAHNWMDQNGV